jgi:hypothetical protein
MTPRPARHIVAWTLRRTGFSGVALPPFGVFILAERMGNERLIKHEMAHWLQYKRMGAVRFYAAYLWGLLRHGYQNHPMEIEARKAEG